MEEKIAIAKYGRELWISLVKKYNIDNSKYVIIIPEDKRIFSELTLCFLKVFLQKRGVKKAIVLTFDNWVIEQAENYSEYAQIEFCGKEDIDALLQFYCLYEFATNIVIASLEKPVGRMGNELIGKKDLTLEEVFAGVVYSITD